MAGLSDHLDPREIAWAAGLFEGEGSIGASRNRKKKTQTPLLQLSMTDGDTVQRFASILGLGRTYRPYDRGLNCKPSYTWRLTSFEKAQAVIAMFWPWLGVRRKKRALEILAEGRAQRVKQAFRQHCPKGHPLSGNNLYISCRGTRNCKVCISERQRLYRTSHREKLNGMQQARRAKRRKEII